jgi:prepilin-type processing-associated H-X9-DG protein
MEPRDLHVSQMASTINPKPGQGISSLHKGGAHILMGDGSARFVSDKTSPEVIRGLLTINGGEQVGKF